MTLKAKIETVLFVTAKAMEVAEIAEILKEPEEDVECALLDLIMDYSAREGALEIDDESGYILQIKEDYMNIVEKLCPTEMKPAVLKTLTIIALKEPIRQSALVDLRGSTAYDHIHELIEKGMISRTKDKNGRSYNLHTTDKFAEYFKLKGDTKTLAKILDMEKDLKDHSKKSSNIELTNDESVETFETAETMDK